jgi:hypothetical protein
MGRGILQRQTGSEMEGILGSCSCDSKHVLVMSCLDRLLQHVECNIDNVLTAPWLESTLYLIRRDQLELYASRDGDSASVPSTSISFE